MKRVVTGAVFLVLLILELYMCTAFLPSRWQLAINDKINSELQHIPPHRYDYSVVTHPALDQEIEQALKENTSVRIFMYAMFTIVFLVNGFAIIRIWGRLRRLSGKAEG
jgi:hypothetical protein